jgi:uncharacterized protein YhaN
MRLKILEIENFGVYRDKRLEFSDAGLHVIYGANEAGKTTLLQLLRDTLFGFPHVSNYANMVSGREVAASCTLTLRDGDELRMRRRKGRKETVSGANISSGDPVREEQWEQILQGATPELFHNVFAFSLSELTRGQESLAHAKLSEALFGGGIGGLRRFQNLRQAVTNEAVEIYNPRGRNQVINQLLRRIGEQQREIREQVFLPSRFDQLQAEIEESESDRERYRQQLTVLRSQLERVRRLSQSQPLCRELAEVQAAWHSLHDVDVVPDGDQEKLERLTATLESLVADLAEDRRKIELLEATVKISDTLPVEEDLARWFAEAEQLYQQVDQIQGYRRDTPRRRAEAESLLQIVDGQVRQWLPGGDLKKLDSMPLRRLDAEKCRQWAERISRSVTKLETLEARREELVGEIELLQEILSAKNESAVARKPACVAGREYLRESTILDDLDEEHQRLADRLEAADRALASGLSDRDAETPITSETGPNETGPNETGVSETGDGTRAEFLWASLAPPAVSEAQGFQLSLTKVEDEFEDAKRELDRCLAEVVRLEEEIRDFVDRQAIPDPDQLTIKRSQRDAILQTLLQEARKGSTENIDELAGSYGEMVSQVDRLADQLLSSANEVARLQRQKQERSRATERAKVLQDQSQESEQRRDSVLNAWQRCCAMTGLNAITPSVFLDWRRQWELALETWLRWKEVGRRRRQAEIDCQRWMAIWKECCPDLHLSETSVQELEAEIERLQRFETERESAAKRLAELELKCEEIGKQLVKVEAEQTTIRGEWTHWQTANDLPSEWTPDLVAVVANELATLQGQAARASDLQRRADEMTNDMNSFVARLLDSCQAMADHFPHRAKELVEMVRADREAEATRELFRFLDDQRQLAQKRQLREEQRETLLNELEAKVARRKHIEGQLSDMYGQVGAADEAAFRQRIAQSTRRREVADRRQNLREKLLVLAGDVDIPSWQVECAASVGHDLADQESQLGGKLSDAESGLEASVQRVAILREQFAAASRATTALSASQHLESLRAELSAAVERWAPLMLAKELMDRALAQFEREHQPAMLTRVAQLLSHMTDGRYIQVTRRFDQGQSLVVQRDNGDYLLPEQLSTGTREQLYLAIRLAFVLHYCDQHEPLPIVMDDVLVNFDDRRARATIEVLENLSTDVQVILLTCHQRTVEMCGDVCANSSPIILGRANSPATSPATSDSISADTADDSPQPRRRRRPAPSAGQGTFFDS